MFADVIFVGFYEKTKLASEAKASNASHLYYISVISTLPMLGD
jgi:hypothetical protein